MKLHFSASEHDEAKLRLTQLTGLYGQTKIEDATHIVALGGDGHMLHVLQDSLSYGLPVFGMNCGRLGFLMNNYENDDLPDRVAAAETAPLHPLRMTATARDGSTINSKWNVLFVTVFLLQPQQDQPPIIYQLKARSFRLAAG